MNDPLVLAQRLQTQPDPSQAPASQPDAAAPAAEQAVTAQPGTLFGFNEAQLAKVGATWGVGLFIALMLWIIWSVAKESKAGRFGTFVLFFVLAFGIFGFVMKTVIEILLKA